MSERSERQADRYEALAVPADGGTIGGGTWAGERGPVLAIHGLSGNHRHWVMLADRMPGHRIVALDLRGRATAAGLPVTDGLRTHADDAVRALDHLGIERAVVAGHSLGAYIAAHVAHRHPDRVAATVLVDGGVTKKLPVRNPAVIRTMFRVALRQPKTFASVADCRRHALRRLRSFDGVDPALVDWMIEPELEPTADGRALRLRRDGRQLLADAVEAFTTHWEDVTTHVRPPATLLRAEWGIAAGKAPMYKPGWLATRPEAAGLEVVDVPGVDHLQLLWSDATVKVIEELAG